MGSTWGPHGPFRPQMGPMLAPWIFQGSLFQVTNELLGNDMSTSLPYWRRPLILIFITRIHRTSCPGHHFHLISGTSIAAWSLFSFCHKPGGHHSYWEVPTRLELYGHQWRTPTLFYLFIFHTWGFFFFGGIQCLLLLQKNRWSVNSKIVDR